jgi:hypothetical protein
MKAYWHEKALISVGESDIENISDLCFLIMTSDVGTMGLKPTPCISYRWRLTNFPFWGRLD